MNTHTNFFYEFFYANIPKLRYRSCDIVCDCFVTDEARERCMTCRQTLVRSDIVLSIVSTSSSHQELYYDLLLVLFPRIFFT
jgi:hypothetical protein